MGAGLLGTSSTAALTQNLVDPDEGATGEEYLYEEPQEYDPFESLNRQIYDFNQIFYDYASDPAIRIYGDATCRKGCARAWRTSLAICVNHSAQ